MAPNPLKLFDDFPALVWSSGRDARCNYFNTAWLEFTGRRLDQELGDGWVEGVHPQDRERCVKQYMMAFRKRRPFTIEYRLRRYDGEFRLITDLGRPIFDASGRFAGYVGGCFDVTEKKQIENLLNLQYVAAVAFSATRDFTVALETLLRLACDFAGLEVGEAWLPDAEGARLRWSGAFYSTLPGMENFVSASIKTISGRREPLPGLAWMKKQSFSRQIRTNAAGRFRTFPVEMRTQCAIPVMADDEVVAILSFFSRRQGACDQRALDTITAIATRVGVLLKRVLAEDALYQSMEERERLMRDLHDNVVQAITSICMDLGACRRTIQSHKSGKNFSAQIGRAINGLSGVIRDLERYAAVVKVQALGGALSKQERRVLGMVAQGKTNKEIAVAMMLSPKTIKNYLRNSFKKLGVHRRAEAAVIYSRASFR